MNMWYDFHTTTMLLKLSHGGIAIYRNIWYIHFHVCGSPNTKAQNNYVFQKYNKLNRLIVISYFTLIVIVNIRFRLLEGYYIDHSMLAGTAWYVFSQITAELNEVNYWDMHKNIWWQNVICATCNIPIWQKSTFFPAFFVFFFKDSVLFIKSGCWYVNVKAQAWRALLDGCTWTTQTHFARRPSLR